MRFAFASLASRNVVPLGALYLAAALRRAGHVVLWHEVEGAEELVRRLRLTSADAVGFSATSGMHVIYLGWAAEVKRRRGPPQKVQIIYE